MSFLADKLSRIKPSPTIAVSTKAAELKAAGLLDSVDEAIDKIGWTPSVEQEEDDGQIDLTHSVSAGLDYAAVGPEHAYYKEKGRIDFGYATDAEALQAFQDLCSIEGIVPALESSHGIAYTMKRAREMSPEQIIIGNLSGRGDKDVQEAARLLGEGH